MEEPIEQQVVVTGTPVDTTNTKTVFGAIYAQTPMWAKWMFRSVIILTTAITVWIAGTSLVDAGIKTELMLGLKVLDVLVFGFSKMFGVVPDEKVQ